MPFVLPRGVAAAAPRGASNARRAARSLPAGLALLVAACQPDRRDLTGLRPAADAARSSAASTARTVNTLGDVVDAAGCDATHCSLREAIAAATTAGAGVTTAIGFDPGLTAGGPASITLDPARGRIIVGGSVTITGPGAAALTVRRAPGATHFGILHIQPNIAVAISGLTISGGSERFGSGIRNAGTLTLTECTITDNGTDGTGGFAPEAGGGIYTDDLSVLRVTRTTIRGNVARIGGGIHNRGVLTIDRSLISGNTGSVGGGLYLDTQQSGVDTGTLIVNSTVSDNTGVGINRFAGRLRIMATTITGNRAGDGGVYIDWVSGVTTIRGSIISGNTDGIGQPADVSVNPFANTTPTSGGGNVIGALRGNVEAARDFSQPGDLVGGDAGLEALADNGGPTRTHALRASSPAGDRAPCTDDVGTQVDTDQRGVARTPGSEGRCDSGAFERGDATAPVIEPTVTGTVGSAGWYRSDVGVAWSVSDPESGIATQAGCGAASVTADTQGVTITCSATSAGGTTTRSVTVKRDATAPTLTAAVTPAVVLQRGSATATATAADPTSGLAGAATCAAVSTATAGARTVACTATDNAGNVASVQASYTVVSVALAVNANATRDRRTGIVTVTGTATCSGAIGVPVEVALTQDVKSGRTTTPVTVRGQGTAACLASGAAAWSIAVATTGTTFGAGAARAVATVSGTDPLVQSPTTAVRVR